MSTGVFFGVIGAALLHAIWNALVKNAADKRMCMGAVVLGHLPFALVALTFAPFPDSSCFPYLITGILLHVGYQLFLLRAYELGELTQVYPIARGSAPLIVAFISVTFLGESLSFFELLAVLIISAGIFSLSIVRRGDGQRNLNAAVLALVTGGFIAAYSLVDGLGARAAGTPLGFYSLLAIGNAIVVGAYLQITTPEVLRTISTQGRSMFLFGGGASFAAYAIVIWAFTLAPIALVAALRETSIVFALLIGVFVLKERLDLSKVISCLTTLLGVVLLRYTKN